MLYLAVDDGADALDVGLPNATRLVMRMADMVARHDALVANLAETGHEKHLPKSDTSKL